MGQVFSVDPGSSLFSDNQTGYNKSRQNALKDFSDLFHGTCYVWQSVFLTLNFSYMFSKIHIFMFIIISFYQRMDF